MVGAVQPGCIGGIEGLAASVAKPGEAWPHKRLCKPCAAEMERCEARSVADQIRCRSLGRCVQSFSNLV